MRRLLLALCALFALPALSVLPTLAADNSVLLTPCASECVTMRTKDVGSGVESPLNIPGDTSGNALATAPGSGNTSFALPIQGVASGVAVPMSASALPLPSGAATAVLQGTNSATTAHTCSTSGYSELGCLGQIDDDIKSPITAGTNVIGYTTPDPCSQAVKINKPISQTTSTNLITGTSGKKIYVCSLSLIVGGAENISFVEGTTGGTCGTSTAAVLGGATAANGPNLAANGGLTLGNGLGTIMSTATNNNDLCLFQSGTDRNAGNLTYVVQ